MQKLNEKKILGTVPKKLQLVETFWDCPEFSRNKQNQKGITLIALIITIIVMLILVGVTVNVALNGGLFQKTEEAKTQTQKETDQEELQLAVVAALNDDLEIPNAGAIKNNLTEGWEVTGPTDGVYTCISPKLNKFTVGETDKKIIYAGIKNTNPETKEFYRVGYCVIVDSKIVCTYYYLENNMVVAMMEEDKTIGNPFLTCGKYTKNGNLLQGDMFDGETGRLSEGYETISIGTEGVLQRNESDIFEYNPTYNENSKIYNNAMYTSLTTENIMTTSNEKIQFSNSYDTGKCLFSEMESEGIETSEDGKQITFEGNIYTLLEEI